MRASNDMSDARGEEGLGLISVMQSNPVRASQATDNSQASAIHMDEDRLKFVKAAECEPLELDPLGLGLSAEGKR